LQDAKKAVLIVVNKRASSVHLAKQKQTTRSSPRVVQSFVIVDRGREIELKN